MPLERLHKTTIKPEMKNKNKTKNKKKNDSLIVRALLIKKLARVFPNIIGNSYNSPRYCCLVSHGESDCYRS